VRPSYGLSDEEVARMLAESIDKASDDQQLRALREAQVDGQRLLEGTRSALVNDADLLEPAERAAIDAALGDLSAVVEGNDVEAIRNATVDLTRATEEFAGRRMNRSIRDALAGSRIDDVLAG